MKKFVSGLSPFFSVMMVISLITGCGSGNRDAGKVLTVEEVDPAGSSGTGTGGSGTGGGTAPGTGDPYTGSAGDGTLHPIFSRALGVPITNTSMGIIDPDPTGYTANTDYDGDGIPNDFEKISNPFVADYPRIVTRISAPITMEIRVSYSSVQDNHTETIEETGVEDTIKNSMEDRQYTQANQKTTPYVTKESYSDSESHSEAYGSSDQWSVGVSGRYGMGGFSANASQSHSQNESISDSFSNSTMSEKTVFEDVDYVDNLDRNGVEFTNETVEKISQNFRKSETLKSTENIGPNDGFVRAALFLKNMTVNMPVKVSNVICTLSFRTPAGEFLPVKTFKLRNEDYSEFNQSVYGGEEMGPYTIEITNLNTYEVMKALKNGYVPQIHVVSYDMHRVEDSNYNPGVDNLKIVEETAKGRTALIKIVGENARETFRVTAFEVDGSDTLSPGISLKKALFNIFRSQTGGGEQWVDSELTVPDSGLKWKNGNDEHTFNPDIRGNSWDMFETYVKSYRDEFDQEHYIETIKRIGALKKYNPFSIIDNPSYSPNELLSETEIKKMKYWIIYHNGRYFQGDINDPIWAGERYEIVCMDIRDFNEHFQNYYYNPIQSGEPVAFNTRWNRLNQDGYFSRAKYIGKIIKGDVIHLEVDLLQSRFLFNPDLVTNSTGSPVLDGGNYLWTDEIFNYTFQPDTSSEVGIPGEFSHWATGGTNNISVEIEDSQFANSFEISFGPMGTPVDSWKTVSITKKELAEKKNTVLITRESIDKYGNPVEFIEGNQVYLTRVNAMGNAYGYTVPTPSSSNGGGNAETTVNNVTTGIMPGGFSFNSFGLLNSIDVRISPWTNTEYYRIEIKGPYNYDTGGGDLPVLKMIARPGSNIVPVVNPSGDPIDPGLYSVNVYAVNNNVPEGVVSSHGEEYVLVNYERYSDQKKDLASVAGGYFDLTALDLEVNFNNGDGWYRLMLSGNDTGERLIDCRYTSYYEQDKQRFHLFFRPPTGEVDPLNPTTNDVFSGGRQEADLYIRTVAENRYRDTFWPRKSDTSNPTISTGTDVVNIINHWIGTPYSDASFIEETIAGAHNDGFSLSSSLVGDYFFSPLEYRAFTIKTILTDTIPDADTSPVDEPVFYAEEGDSVIEISNISSVYGYKYRIYWLYVDGYTRDQIDNLGNDTFLDNWNSSGEVMASALGAVGTPTNSYTIPDLIPNREYVVAVRGYNSYGKGSKPVFIKYTKNNVEHIQSFIPFSTLPPAKPAGISLGLGVDGRSIHVDRIYVPDPNIDRYEVRWYRLADNIVSSDTVSSDGVHYASYHIQNLNFWDSYAVQARALRITSEVWGEWSDPVMIETADYESGNITLSSVTSNVSGIPWSNRPSVMMITLGGLGVPAGTASYNVNYTLTLIYDDPDYTSMPTDWHDSGYTNIINGTVTGSSQISYTFNANESPYYNAHWYGLCSGGGSVFYYDDWSPTRPQLQGYTCSVSITEEVEYKPHIYLDLTVEAVNSYNESIIRDFHYTVLP